MFSQMLNAAIKVAQRYDRKFSVMFVDLDRFKLINDTLGHAAGDILLKGVASQFRQCLRDSDVLARFGGDEFVILLHEVSDVAQVSAVARRLLSAAVTPIMIHGRECRVTASIGVAKFPDHGTDEQSLTKNADAAMYLAKERVAAASVSSPGKLRRNRLSGLCWRLACGARSSATNSCCITRQSRISRRAKYRV
jgi:diguanylate cyclase (GGDEF)-like protein